MNEEKVVHYIMETRERVAQLEQNGFTPADRERMNSIFNAVEIFSGEIKGIKEELGHVNFHLRRIEEKFDSKFDLLQEAVAELQVDVGQLKVEVSSLFVDMGKVKIKLAIT